MLGFHRFSSSEHAGHRFGFNGMEKDDEVHGITGSSYTADFWQYDPRLGRRWNIDPLTYPWQSSYAAFNNNPIYFADPTGLEGDPKPGDVNDQNQTWGYNGVTGKYQWTDPKETVTVSGQVGEASGASLARSGGSGSDPMADGMEIVGDASVGVDQAIAILEETGRDGSKTFRALNTANAAASGLEFVNLTRKLSQNPDMPLSEMPSPVDLVGLGGAADMALEMGTPIELYASDEFEIQGANGSYNRFRDWANKANQERSSSSLNTIIVVYTASKIGAQPGLDMPIFHNAMPSTYVSYDQVEASREYGFKVGFAYWGYQSDYENDGTFTPRGVFKVD